MMCVCVCACERVKEEEEECNRPTTYKARHWHAVKLTHSNELSLS
jgi:hypothetical protein